MKRFIKGIVCIMLFSCLVACSSSKSPEDILKILEDKGFTFRISYDVYGNSYDVDGKCYDYKGNETTCSRIMEDIKIEDAFIRGENSSFMLNSSIDEEGTVKVSWTKDSANSAYTFSDKIEMVYIDSCYYYYKGDNPSKNNCDESKKEGADKVKADFETATKELSISENELKEFYKWFYDNKVKALTDSLQKTKDSQKSLTNSEVKAVLSKSYDISEIEGQVVLLDKLFDKRFMTFNGKDGKPFAIFYEYDTYSGEKSKNQMTIAYILGEKYFMSNNEANTCSYDVTNGVVLNGKTCTDEQKNDADMLQYAFESDLRDLKITIDEFVNFMTTY